MRTKHFSHAHELTFYEESKEILEHLLPKYNSQDGYIGCDGCRDELVKGPAYFCQHCEEFYVLHKSCFDLPSELKSTPLHSTDDHPLILGVSNSDGFICNCCRNYRAGGFTYSCRKCRINLDINCALQTKSSNCDHQQSNNNNLVTEVEHFLDPDHKLVLLYISSEVCTVCNVPLSSDDACYGCLKCGLLLHKSCLQEPQVIQHPYHPHRLDATRMMYSEKCVACKSETISLQYACLEESCKFNLHAPCANNLRDQTTPLWLKCYHQHGLYCFVVPDSIDSKFGCDMCDQLCQGAFYMCFECDFTAHPKCILPPNVKHECHSHPLTLKDSFREDDSGEYICYACGEPRNGNYPLYLCEECPEGCPYTAHIECIIPNDQEDDESFCKTSPRIVDGKGLQIIETVKAEAREQKGDLKAQMHEIDSHDHQLTFHAKEGLEVINCYECKTEIQGGKMYTCQFCCIHFHPSCTTFPERIIRHSLHEHPLVRSPGEFTFKCDLCRNICYGFNYLCHTCFHCSLGEECAFLSDDQCHSLNEKHPEVKIQHFTHDPHELELAICSSELGKRCEICQLPISGLTYCCVTGRCKFFLHDSCLEMKQEIQSSYHLPHQLAVHDFELGGETCDVCGSRISYVGYACHQCKFSLHVKCATDPTYTLKHEFHEHNLYSFAPCDIWGDARNSKFWCCKCSYKIRDSFYRCVECDLSIHLECIGLPKVVKHGCHVDPLTLRHSFHEDYNSGEYYCNVCEEPRNPNHPCYLCEECWSNGYVFVAHVGCVIEEGDTSLEVLLLEAEIKDEQQETKSIEISRLVENANE